jgi:hypothetical protein
MEQPLGVAAASAAGHAVGAARELLALVFERLPPAECLTVGRLARAWRRWAWPRRRRFLAGWRDLLAHKRPQLPRWCVAEAWPRLSERQRGLAARRAAACGDLERLRWLLSQDPPCPLWEETCGDAAAEGHVDVLRLLRAQDPPCPWGVLTCTLAAANGHVDVLQWLRAQDPACPWWELTSNRAAENGHLDALRWLRAQDPPCPWGGETFHLAAQHGHLDVLLWLRAQDPRALGASVHAAMQPWAATSMCCVGCGPRIRLAPGTFGRAAMHPGAATCMCCSGCGPKTHRALGTRAHALMRREASQSARGSTRSRTTEL